MEMQVSFGKRNNSRLNLAHVAERSYLRFADYPYENKTVFVFVGAVAGIHLIHLCTRHYVAGVVLGLSENGTGKMVG